jgi:tetratricopeptide (TPR) repeat protein
MIKAGVLACLLLFMRKFPGLCFFALTIFLVQRGFPQASNPAAPTGKHALDLAKSGHCTEAIPLLKKAIAQSTEKSFRRNAGLAGVRCAMVKNQFDAADEFLRQLTRQFPDDPEVLYTAVHTYSDLATRASQQLAVRAPKSAQAHELRAESLEMQGKWDAAAKEYQQILQMDPQMPGIHFKMGRLLLSEPNPPGDAAAQAKKEFEQELQIDPSNAGAEYVLGELAREAQQWDEAIQHFSRAAKLDATFGDAFLGWGSALISLKKFPEAVPPLEEAVKLEPENPAAHYNLAVAYTRTGRKQEADREFAVHREMIQGNQPSDAQQPQAQSAPQQ